MINNQNLRHQNTAAPTRPQSMRRLTVLLLMVILLPALAVQAVLGYLSYAESRRTEEAANVEVARAVASLFSNYVGEMHRHQIAIGAAILGVQGDAGSVDMLLREQSDQYASVKSFSYADRDGTVVASSDQRLVGLSFSNHAHFAKAMSSVQGWALGNLVRDAGDGEAVFHISRVARDADGDVHGVVVATISPQLLQPYVFGIDRLQQGIVLLFDSDGRLVYRDPPIDVTWQQRAPEIWLEKTQQSARTGVESIGVSVSPLTGERLLTARVPIPEMGYTAGAGRPTANVSGPVWRTLRVVAGLNLAVLAGSLAVAFLAARRLTTSLAALRDHVEQTEAGGDVPPPLPDMAVAELYDLAARWHEASRLRRLGEQALRESEARYSSIFHNNHAVMMLIDPQTGNIVDANPAAERFYGYDSQTFRQMKISQINMLPPDQIHSEMSRAAKGDKKRFEFPHRLASGEIRQVEVYSGRILVAGRDLLYSLVHDVTQRKIAADALKAGEAQLRLLSELVPQIIWSATPDGEFDYFNSRFTQYTGVPVDEALGMRWTKCIHGEDLEQTVDAWRRSIRTGEPQRAEFRLRQASGEYRWHMAMSQPLTDDNGNVTRWFGTSTDVHDLKLAQEELERSNYDLQQFAYVASHDLQEPLRMVTGFMNLLETRYGDRLDEQAREYISYASEGGRRMQELIRDLLDYSRAGSDRQPRAAVDSHRSLRKAMLNLKNAIEDAEAEVIVEGDMPVVLAEEGQLAQVFQNLVANAVKFRRSDVRPVVRVGACEDGPRWVFYVHDNGIGIERDQADRVFKIFHRLHTRQQYPGTGIGLAIVKRIVDRHGGRAWVDSKPGEGSTFYFTMPAA